MKEVIKSTMTELQAFQGREKYLQLISQTANCLDWGWSSIGRALVWRT